ncbi:sulfite exporter TauE/SafE family protein [Xanthomarina sp. F1114]|uniref:sulfite exporter TauE/SafE family protein n=1 Tax=Xanthomarina sp. F1114 TaxID=2996019 RepID=UPI00225E21D3|nr:sulfite exporter TauE/SafE family protein [Xanthomarina sp. F1114]MCX7548589.1 sulfite exporter TauE/SafE family protein [Xanthomarina sp. F1114]
MDLNTIFGYFGALLIGVVLGLIGGGGSILTVPVFVYLFSLNPITATAYSLFVVGVSSAFGTIKNIQKHLVNFKVALVFTVPAFTAVYLTRRFILPAIPENLFVINNYVVTKDMAIMTLFAIMMLLAAGTMLKKKKVSDVTQEPVKLNYFLIFNQAIIIGLFTGLVGAGGGFIIIPALIALANLPMKEAVGTSLLIIAINSLIGFTGDFGHLDVDWLFLLGFTALAVIGIFIGTYMSNFIDGKKLKKGFGWFVLFMGIYILYKELTV